MNEEGDASGIYGSRAAGGQFYRRPGARLTEPQDESVIALSSGSSGLHEEFHAFDTAHVVMLAEENLIPDGAAREILEAFREMEAEGVVTTRERMNHSAHSGEAYLIERLGEDVGGYVHLGRSSHDLGAVATRRMFRRKSLSLIESCLDLMERYADTAAEYTETPIPTYTGLQHAQVASIAFCLLGWERAIERDLERLFEAYDRVNTSPAGAAVGTTSDFPVDRERVADLLGFDGLLDNGEDVDKSFDVVLECGAVLATLAADVARAADTALIWYSEEFGYLDVPDRYCGTSSIMPQKRNPHTIQHVQRRTNGIIGSLSEAFVATKNVGGGVGLGSEAFDGTIEIVDTWTAFIEHATFDEELARERVYEEWALATDVAGALVREADLPWRTAHQITAVLVRQSKESGVGVRELTPEHVARAAETYLGEPVVVEREALEAVIDADRALEARAAVSGSPEPEQVETQLSATYQRIETGRDELASRRKAVEKADQRLDEAIDAILEP